MTIVPAPLTFPPHTHAKVSPRTYLSAHLRHQPPLRPSARSPTETRPINIHSGSLSHTHGSAVVRIGDTAVVCGVRGEILRGEDIADHEYRRYEDELGRGSDGSRDGDRASKEEREEKEELVQLGLLVPNIELATGCSPHYLPGAPPSTTAQALTQRVLTLLHASGAVRMDGLRIWYRPPTSASTHHGGADWGTEVGQDAGQGMDETADAGRGEKAEVKAFWTLYIDILFLSLDHGANGMIDAAWLAVLAALRDTRLHKAWWHTELDGVLCDPDPERSTALLLREDLPIVLSFGVFKAPSDDGAHASGEGKENHFLLTDPDAFEESVCEETATISVFRDGKIARIEKNGGGTVGMKGMREVMARAEERRMECIQALKGV
ncbi:MAG: hypothetical protein Q9163_001077 [Psora crenata]